VLRAGGVLLTETGTRRERLARARIQLILTPAVCRGRDPLELLAAALEWVDVVQVRPKPLGDPEHTTSASEAREWTERVLAVTRDTPALVLVNDRVDVARTLLEAGCDGVHLGQDDAPPSTARDQLGEEALIGLSTHDARQVVLAGEEPVDYLGFGPVFATATKGRERGLGPEAAWVAAEASTVPVFAIGGIDASNAGQLDRVGRAAVSAGILAASAPAEAARTIRALLTEPADS
jgi:thiamine-phosphate pyrophosphorylase